MPGPRALLCSGIGVREKLRWVQKPQPSPGVIHSRAISRDGPHGWSSLLQKKATCRPAGQDAKPDASSPLYLLEGTGGWVVYLVGRSLFLLTLGRKGTTLCMFTESPMCSLRHEDRACPYKSGWRKNK